jgi:hypothetical protein
MARWKGGTIMGRQVLAASFVVALVCLGGAQALAQGGGMPGMPSPEEIERRIQEELDKIPDTTVGDDVMEITYKAVPLDPNEIVKRAAAAGGQLPAGMTPDQIAKQVLPMARPYIERTFAEIGTIRVTGIVAYKSAKLEEGEYIFGLVMNGMTPVGVRIAGASLKREVRVPFRASRSKELHSELKLDVEEDERGGKRYIVAFFNDVQGKAGKFVSK